MRSLSLAPISSRESTPRCSGALRLRPRSPATWRAISSAAASSASLGALGVALAGALLVVGAGFFFASAAGGAATRHEAQARAAANLMAGILAEYGDGGAILPGGLGGLGDGDAVAALALGDVERLVGPRHQRRQRDLVGAARQRGDADRGGHLERRIVDGEGGGLDGGADAVGDDLGAGDADVGQKDAELLAAVAREDVADAQAAAHDLDEARQDGVAAEVAEAVVDLLEVIEVEDDERQRRAGAARA